MLVVDTSVWSLAFRRRLGQPEPPAARLLRSLISEAQPVLLPAIVRQELLSGLRHAAQFERLVVATEPFKTVLATAEDHVRAAQVANACRRGGVQTGAVDALLVAMTLRLDGVLMTTDADFDFMKRHVDFNLELLPVA